MPILRLDGIGKAFYGVSVLNNIDIAIETQKIHAIVGENGAGKSTLMNILIGKFPQYEGQVYFEGRAVQIANPRVSRDLGIGMIHQELTLLPKRSIAQNILLGREPLTKFGFIDARQMHRSAQKYLEALDLNVNPAQEVASLPIALRQMVEIAKTLSLNARVLILDEPTSSLSEKEARVLFELLKKLRSAGIAILYISHRLEEVFDLADTITVLRDGRLIESRDAGSFSPDSVIRSMVGREIQEIYKQNTEEVRKGGASSEALVRVRGLTGQGFSNVSLEVHRGEVVGMAGLVGSGRSEFARALAGVDSVSSGEIYYKNVRYTGLRVREAIAQGIVLVPEDRKEEGLFLALNVCKNICMQVLSRVSMLGFLRASRMRKIAQRYVQELSIRPPDLKKLCQNLSGGNQQKLVVAKWLSVEPELLILDEPTRGIDVGARQDMYALIRKLAREGRAILVISSDLPEVLGLSDRIYVMRSGGIAGELSAEEADQTRVMQLAAGAELRREGENEKPGSTAEGTSA